MIRPIYRVSKDRKTQAKGSRKMNNKIILHVCLLFVLPFSAIGTGVAQEPAQESLQDELIVPEGTVIPIVLTAFLNTRNSQVGDAVYADTTYPVWIQQQLVIPKGSTIRGTVTEVVQPGKVKGKGKLAVRFDDILLPNGVKRDLSASFKGIHGAGAETIDRKSETVSAGGGGNKGAEIGTVVGTSATGAVIGAIADEGATGTLIGAGVGAAAGIATVLFSRDRHLVISPGTQFDLELKRALKFAYNELIFSDSELNSFRPRTYPNASPSNRRSPIWGGRGPMPYPGTGIPPF
jgi:hypothetical protein